MLIGSSKAHPSLGGRSAGFSVCTCLVIIWPVQMKSWCILETGYSVLAHPLVYQWDCMPTSPSLSSLGADSFDNRGDLWGSYVDAWFCICYLLDRGLLYLMSLYEENGAPAGKYRWDAACYSNSVALVDDIHFYFIYSFPLLFLSYFLFLLVRSSGEQLL